jgi:hypothetical protein
MLEAHVADTAATSALSASVLSKLLPLANRTDDNTAHTKRLLLSIDDKLASIRAAAYIAAASAVVCALALLFH